MVTPTLELFYSPTMAKELKRFVDRIMLFSGNSDFVPAAKLARREGVDFVLDPMHANVVPQLFEHIDGMKSVNPNIQKHL